MNLFSFPRSMVNILLSFIILFLFLNFFSPPLPSPSSTNKMKISWKRLSKSYSRLQLEKIENLNLNRFPWLEALLMSSHILDNLYLSFSIAIQIYLNVCVYPIIHPSTYTEKVNTGKRENSCDAYQMLWELEETRN